MHARQTSEMSTSVVANRPTLSGQKLKRRNDAQELMLHLPDVGQDVSAGFRGATGLERVSFLSHQPLQDLHQVLEEIDVDQVGEPGDASQRRRQQRRRVRVLEDPEVQHEQELERLRLLSTGVSASVVRWRNVTRIAGDLR